MRPDSVWRRPGRTVVQASALPALAQALRVGRLCSSSVETSSAMNSEIDILRNRIKFAVRRCTGRVVDMDAMLGRPELRAPRIQAWRQIGSAGLNALLDQLESEFQENVESQEFGAQAPVHKVLKGVQLVPRSPRAQ